MTVMTNKEFASKCREVAEKYRTLYVKGCFGAPLNATNKARYTANNTYNAGRADIINAVSEDTFGFDCVCLVKGILWGWDGDTSATYGGATYASNGVPDIGTEVIIGKCSDVSTDFTDIEIGELLWKSGHVGVYIGEGLGVECTPSWDNDVQITAVDNIGAIDGYHSRTWTKHGKLPYVEYVADDTADVVENSNEDDGASEWAKEATEAMKAAGVFLGDDKGDYNWQNYITREETAAIICRVCDIPLSNVSTSDDDASEWAVPYTRACKENGIFTGHDTGDYDWHGYITREQFAAVVCRAGLVEVPKNVTASNDRASEWAIPYTESCKHAGVFRGDGTGEYNWQDNITREEAALVLYRTITL